MAYIRSAIAKFFFPLIAVIMFCSAIVYGQVDPPDDLVPPPISIVSDQEKEQLEGEESIDDRTRLALRFMEDRLKQSETLAEKEEYENSLGELGYFRALMNDTLALLLRNSHKSSNLKNLKRFEKKLKDFIPRLELVRREMPYRFSYHVGELISSVKDTREKSIEPFYGDTVIPNGL